MYKNNSTTDSFPKTLIIRNSKGGMIWQVYHVQKESEAEKLSHNATMNGFECVSLEDYDESMEETWTDWRETCNKTILE